jgi:undecaprenyl-diphosphatase
MTGKRAFLFLVGVLVPFAVFLALAEGLDEAWLSGVDRSVLRTVEHLHGDALTTLIKVITFFGASWGAALLTIAAISVLLWYRRRRDAVFLAAAMAGSGILQFVTKLVFERPRPAVFTPLTSWSTYSYPSGHAMASATLALALAVICWHTRLRWAAVASGTAFALLIAFTRLYLGVHYPSDILAGWLLSIAWVVVLLLLFDLFGKPVGAARSPSSAAAVPPGPSTL